MNLVTLVLLCCLSTLLFCLSGDKAPDALETFQKKMEPIKENLGLGSIIWGILAVFGSLVSLVNSSYFIISLLASFIVLTLALPFGINKIFSYVKMDNPILKETITESIGKIEKHSKIFAIIGYVAAALLFFVIFR